MSPFTGESTWSLGTLIWLPLFTLITVALIVATVWALRERKAAMRRSSAREDATFFAAIAGGLAVVVAVLTALGMWPYDVEYHKWHVVHGTVTQIDKRLIAEDKAMSERFVVEVAGQPFGVDDTRAATLREGDTVTLSCKREWQYAAESGWACRWLGSDR